MRRSLTSGELAYYLCYGPAETGLAELVQVAGVSWTVECGFQQGEGEAGLDHYEVSRCQGWYRHVTLSMLAQASLAVQRARAAVVGTGGAERAELAEPLVPLSVPGSAAAVPTGLAAAGRAARVLGWSWWRDGWPYMKKMSVACRQLRRNLATLSGG